MSKKKFPSCETVAMFFLFGFVGSSALACSAYQGTFETGEVYYCKSFDWSMYHGHLEVNQRGLAKESIQLLPSDRPLKWISKYGSVSFNQAGLEFPVGGMNEAGLVIETLWLKGSTTERLDERPSLNEAQFVQWVLDLFSTTKELVAELPAVRIAPLFGTVHFLVCDSSKSCLAIEVLNGSKKTFNYVATPKALTNTIVSDAAEELKAYKDFGGSKKIPEKNYDSVTRFAILAQASKSKRGSLKLAVSTLERVESIGYSRWNIVYDQTNRELYFRNLAVDRKTMPKISLSDLNFDCESPQLFADLEESARSGKFNFSLLTFEKNKVMVNRTLDHYRLGDLVEKTANFPKKTVCKKSN